jgi:NAD+ synthase (glutamine-hydrolysing)
MLCTRAADNLVVVCYAAWWAGRDEILYDGGSLIIDEQGRVLAEGQMFAEDMVVADVDLDEVFNARLHDPRLRKGRVMDGGEPAARIELGAGGGVTVPVGAGARAGDGGVATAVAVKPELETRTPAAERPLVAEVYDALVLGTRDYVGKNGFETVVLGLSGGIDSALTACIAVDALGSKNVVGVSMPSQYTSGESRIDAEALARALGIRFYSIPIHEVFDSTSARSSPALADRPPDTTENLRRGSAATT